MQIEHPAIPAIKAFRSAGNPVDRVDALFLGFELLLRIDALILASTYLSTPECRDDKVRTLLLSRRFELGNWYDLLRTLISVVPAGFHPDLKDWFSLMKKGKAQSTLERLISWRNLRTHSENRTDPQFITDVLAKGSVLFEECLLAHPVLAEFQGRSDGRILTESGQTCMNCTPFLLAGDLIGEPRSLLIYRGASANNLSYASVSGGEFRSCDHYETLVACLRKKISLLERIDSTAPPDVFNERARDVTQRTIRRLIDLKIFRPEHMVQRIEADAAFEAFLAGDRPLLMVSGLEGSGKTSWLCQIASGRLANGRAAFLETADRLPIPVLPDSLATVLKSDGEIAPALDRIGVVSTDGRSMFAIDDVGCCGQEDQILLSLFRWVEGLTQSSSIRLVVTARSDRLLDFFDRHPSALPLHLVREFQMPTLSQNELLELADKLPIRLGTDECEEISRRHEIVLRLEEIGDASARLPGLVTTILESADTHTWQAGFSVAAIYTEIFRQKVLGITKVQGLPKTPGCAKVVRRIAEFLLLDGASRIPIDDIRLESANLIEKETGERSQNYASLVANSVLVESFEDFMTYVSFADPRFFEYIAALGIGPNLPNSLGELCQKTASFPPALPVAAFVVARSHHALSPPMVAGDLLALSVFRHQLLLEIAFVDPVSFLAILDEVACLDLNEAHALVESLIDRGEARLALRASQILVERSTKSAELMANAHFLRARAFYEVDDYEGVQTELFHLGPTRSRASLLLEAETHVARGDFERARVAYDAAIDSAELVMAQRGAALRGLGYALGRMGHIIEAKQRLTEAIEILTSLGDTPALAEAYGDFGELLGKDGQILEARERLEMSRSINVRLGRIGGVAITEGLLAELDLAERKPELAKTRLQSALIVARRLNYRWRVAWILQRLAEAHRQSGRFEEAVSTADEAKKLFDALGSKRQ